MADQSSTLSGIIPALVTPRKPDVDDVDTGVLSTLVDSLIDAGVHGIFPASSTGEAPLLTRDQRVAVIETTVTAARGRIPVLAGVGASSTAASIAYARDAEDAGADYVVVLPSHFVPLSVDELYTYFAAVADSVDIPTLLYNYPARTSGQNIPPSMAAKLASTHNVVGIKDSSGDLTNTVAYIDACGANFSVFTGSESLIYPCMAMGGVGSICAGANVYPRKLVALYNSLPFREGAGVGAALQKQLLPLRRWGSIGTFPAPVKAAMTLTGRPVGDPFLPVSPLDADHLKELQSILDKIGPDTP